MSAFTKGLVWSGVWIAVILSCWNEAPGQTLTFAHDHSPDGKPIGVSDTFNLRQAGEIVEFIYANPKPIFSPKLYFFIDRWENDHFEEYDTKSCIVEHGTTWTAIQYRFVRAGAYRVQVMTAEKKEICNKQLQVNITESTDSPAYFEGVRAYVCTAAPNGIPIDTLKTYGLKANQSASLSLLLKHSKPLSTSRVLVDVWVGTGEQDDIYLETAEYVTNPEWKHMQFKYEFKSFGVYTLRFYSENEVYMCSTKVTIETR